MFKNLYLIALIPDHDVRQMVRDLKLEMKKRYKSSHTLKAPAHITLQMPFRREESEESAILHELQKFSFEQSPFKVKLDGFDAFPPRVIFLNIVDPRPIIELHNQLNQLLTDQLNFEISELNSELHPHMTIATRDLSKKMFYKAWEEFKERSFEASFHCESVHLLKHNGKNWDFFREFYF